MYWFASYCAHREERDNGGGSCEERGDVVDHKRDAMSCGCVGSKDDISGFGSLSTTSFSTVDDGQSITMPQKVVTTPYPLIDSDPHAFRVVRYFRPSDYVTVAAGTAAFPTAMYLWGECPAYRQFRSH